MTAEVAAAPVPSAEADSEDEIKSLDAGLKASSTRNLLHASRSAACRGVPHNL